MFFSDFWGTCYSMSMYDCNRAWGFSEPLNRSVVEAFHFRSGQGDFWYPMLLETGWMEVLL